MTDKPKSKQVVDTLRGALTTGFTTVKSLPDRVGAALPSKQTVKVTVGKALVTGGKALIDPRAAVGELAVRMGEGLMADVDELAWFVVCIADDGSTATYPFVNKTDAEAFFQATLEASTRANARQFLCQATRASQKLG